ncbi:MAG: GNAT family N-acetyltransferase, partial [Chloroflexi bacterium]|nr:GNAT family N-acetyltransferase [Chloroflexota bacterium]
AMAMATAVIQHALAVGIHDIGWVCWTNNLPSVATAEKLGFERVAETAVHLIFTDKAVAWSVQGNLRFEEDDYSGAATWYEKAVQADNVPDWIYWNAACVYAYLNQTDVLFRHLYSAAEAGVTNVEMITNSRHFKHLHETAVWQTYLQHVENLQSRGENDI